MNILITGSKGFIGKNLKSHLVQNLDYIIHEYNRGDSIELLKEKISISDIIFHLAGENRTENELNRQTQLDIAAMRSGDKDALYNIMLEGYINDDLPPQVAERAAKFSTQNTDELRAAVGGQRYGGVLTFDVRDPNMNKKQIRALDGKVVYDPFEDNYKYIVIRDGEVYFDEFKTIGEIQFTTPEVETEQKKIEPVDPFSPNIEDIQGS